MFGYEWNEQEERKALLEAAENIIPICNLVLKGLVNISDLKASGDYTPEELAAVSTSI